MKTLLFLLTILALTSEATAQTVVRSEVNLVNVAFVARDSEGKLVEDLTRNDIELYEDEVPQKIEFFTKSTDLPLSLGLLVDISNSQDHFGKQHKKDLQGFLKEVLRPQDRAFLLCFGNHLRLMSDFTNSPEQILVQYERFDMEAARYPELGPQDDRELGTAFYDAIFYSITERLEQAQGRKAILMFSDGEDNSSSHNMMTTLETAQAANVILYNIRYTEARHGHLTARNKYGISVMDRMAKDSGGLHIDARETSPRDYFRQIAGELRTSYEVGYYPTHKVKDDNFRKIVIRTRRQGITIRSKPGYFEK